MTFLENKVPFLELNVKKKNNSHLFCVCLNGQTKKVPTNKEKLFIEWGYTVEDARWLQAEIERQAREKYISGEYALGRLNWNGQRISIRITIPRKDGSGEVSFITGWMVEPNGKLRLTTPYGGK